MSSRLSEDQVAALIAAAREGTATEQSGSVRRARPHRVREVDFSRPTKFTQEQVRRIERSHEAFCRAMALRFSTELRLESELEVIDIGQLTYSGAIEQLPQSVLFAVVKCRELETSIVLAIELQAAMNFVERMLGGTGETRIAERELTDIEVAIAKRLYDLMLQELSHTWNDLLGLTLELDRIEVLAVNLQVAPPTEPAIVLTIEVSALASTITLVIPYRSIEGAVHRLPASQADNSVATEHDEGVAEAVLDGLSKVEVELRVEIPARELPLADVLRIALGDVLLLGGPAAAGVQVSANDAPLHRARPGRRGSHRAIEIVERLEREA
ncbi:MAG: flagellar motor switch protein FliM [Gaiella sp.]